MTSKAIGKFVVGSPDGLLISAVNGEVCDGTSILRPNRVEVKQNARQAVNSRTVGIAPFHRQTLIEIATGPEIFACRAAASQAPFLETPGGDIRGSPGEIARRSLAIRDSRSPIR